jgi:hypothetical protein
MSIVVDWSQLVPSTALGNKEDAEVAGWAYRVLEIHKCGEEQRQM